MAWRVQNSISTKNLPVQILYQFCFQSIRYYRFPSPLTWQLSFWRQMKTNIFYIKLSYHFRTVTYYNLRTARSKSQRNTSSWVSFKLLHFICIQWLCADDTNTLKLYYYIHLRKVLVSCLVNAPFISFKWFFFLLILVSFHPVTISFQSGWAFVTNTTH